MKITKIVANNNNKGEPITCFYRYMTMRPFPYFYRGHFDYWTTEINDKAIKFKPVFGITKTVTHNSIPSGGARAARW